MYRLFGAILAAAVFVAACGGGAPGASPGRGGTTGSPAVDAALDTLCGTGDASLTSLATELDALDATTDTTQVSAAIGETMTALEDANVDASATTARDAAVTALQQLQGALSDPATREAVATQAAEALRTLDTQICT